MNFYQPCGNWKTKDNTEVTSNSCEILEELVLNGFIPLIHGDCVLDSVRGCTILSGDTIIEVKISKD